MSASVLDAMRARREGAYAAVDFKDRGVRYLHGEVYPVDEISDAKLLDLVVAHLLSPGPPPEKHARRAAERRAAAAPAPAHPTEEAP